MTVYFDKALQLPIGMFVIEHPMRGVIACTQIVRLTLARVYFKPETFMRFAGIRESKRG